MFEEENIKKLPGQMLDLTKASIFGSIGAGIIGGSSLPSPIKLGAQGLIGVGLLKGASNLFK